MEASTPTPIHPPRPSFKPNTHKIKRHLLQRGVTPTPKILHTLHKKELQKFNRKSKKLAQQQNPIPESQQEQISQETHFQTIRHEYKTITNGADLMVGKPWERLERIGFRGLTSGSKEYGGEKLKGEYLVELSEILAQRAGGGKHWLLEEDLEEGEWMQQEGVKTELLKKRQVSDAEAVQFLVKRLSATDLTVKDWKFSKMMKQSGLVFTERHLIKILEGLGAVGSWKHALSVVEWVYNCDEYKQQKSRFVYTKLLAVLGKARKPNEALHIFNIMREDCRIYPDMPAYHSIAVTLGQAGLVKELLDVIECMRLGPSKKIKNMRKDWDPSLEPNVVVYNAVLNACVSSHHWKGVSWVMEEMRKVGLKPNGATFGLAMEVMLRSRKYDLVHVFFEKMRRGGAVPKAITYKVLVRAFWEEGKVNEAVEAVRDMERRGVVGTASVYYELACCLCKNGRWKEAMVEVEKLKMLHLTKPLEVTFTGMIISCMDGGHINDCISVFHEMVHHCSPNIGTINAMLKVYGRNDMFAKAKELFEKIKEMESGPNGHVSNSDSSLTPDAFTYTAMLEASASAHQWEYFEYVYKEMTFCGCQLDQNKHAYVLVEASKAGKEHLLEHAFDLILEAGEIPHLTFFTEMVCQATSRQNYERAVNLLNSMAHASFNVSEKQWTDICTGWQDRISKDGLQNLCNELCSSALVSETILSNLSESLQSICGLNPLSDSLELIAFNKVATTDLNDSPDKLAAEKDKKKAFSIDAGNLTSKNSSNISGDIGDHADCSLTSNQRQTTRLSGHSDDMNDFPASCVSVGCFDYSGPSLADPNRNSENIDENIDLFTSNVEFKSDHLPDASEILKKWKESRNKDSIFLPFG